MAVVDNIIIDYVMWCIIYDNNENFTLVLTHHHYVYIWITCF